MNSGSRAVYTLAIVGGRTYTDWDGFCAHMAVYVKEFGMPYTVVSGGAAGADTMAKRWADERFLRTLTYRPNYEVHNAMFAPLIRNDAIVKAADRVLAFPTQDSRGTWDTIQKAKRFGKPCTVIEVRGGSG